MANYKADKEDAERISRYQVEVLNKREGRPAGTKPPEWLLITKVAWYVPEWIIMQALMSMQDKAEQRKNPEMEYCKDLTRYYFATVRSMCREYDTGKEINWSKRGDAE
jgi:hypothetical protein